jgi:CDP-glycerol glycerophosphotransferase
VVRTLPVLVEAFNTNAIDDADARRARAAFRQRFCPHIDGTASERVVRRVFLGEPADGTPPGMTAQRRPAEAVTERLSGTTVAPA